MVSDVGDFMHLFVREKKIFFLSIYFNNSNFRLFKYSGLQVDEIDERKHALLPENYKNLQQAVRF